MPSNHDFASKSRPRRACLPLGRIPSPAKWGFLSRVSFLSWLSRPKGLLLPDLYHAYLAYCKALGEKHLVTSDAFGQRLGWRGFSKIRITGIGSHLLRHGPQEITNHLAVTERQRGGTTQQPNHLTTHCLTTGFYRVYSVFPINFPNVNKTVASS